LLSASGLPDEPAIVANIVGFMKITPSKGMNLITSFPENMAEATVMII